MALFAFILLSFALQTSCKTIRHRWLTVAAGDSVLLDIELPDGWINTNVTWKKDSRWSIGKYQVIANNTFGPINTKLHITRCEDNELEIENIDKYWGTGQWLAEYYNYFTLKKELTIWHVTVINPLPILIPLKLYDYWDATPGLIVECKDLTAKKDDAYMVIFDKNRDLYYDVLEKHGAFEKKVVFYADPEAACPGHALVRCCSRHSFGAECSDWTEIYLGKYLASSDAGSRSVCPVTWQTYNSNLPTLSASTCVQSATHVSAISTNYFCPSETVWLKSWGKSNYTKWMVRSYPGGRYFSLQGPRYNTTKTLIIHNLSAFDTGTYAWRNSKYYKSQFDIEVQEQLTVGIKLKEITTDKIVLQCVHSFYKSHESVSFAWSLKHKISHYKIQNDIITLYPDCWHTVFHWSSEFSVRCHVNTELWRGHSDWFTSSLTRESTKYTSKACKGFILKRPYYKKSKGLGAIFSQYHEVIV